MHQAHLDTKELRLKRQHQDRRLFRTRARVQGTTDRPRLMVKISLRHVSAQIIDDSTSKTLAATSSALSKDAGKTMTDKAIWVGTQIAEIAQKNNISRVVFDRGAKQYHGRVAALAEAARKQGLEF